MPKIKLILFSAVLLLTLCVFSTVSYAYVYSGYRWPDPAMGEGYRINPNCTDPNVGTDQHIIDAIGAGARAWMNEGNANFTFNYIGDTTAVLPNDGNPQGGGIYNNSNEIMFVQASQNYWYFQPPQDNIIAVTWTWYSTPSNLIFEDDMAFNDGNFVFSAFEEPQGNEMDVWNIAAHEFGHYLMLYETWNIWDATMYGYSANGQTIKRDLHPDDVAGIQYIYGAASNTNPVLSNGIVTPTVGGIETVFSYRVNYYDANGGFSNAQATVNGTQYPMTLYSGTPANGTYKYDTAIGYPTNPEFGFYAEDGQGGSDILPVLGYFSGPEIIPVTVDLVCQNPVVPQGGTLLFDITIANQNTITGYGLTVVSYVILPSGSQYGPLIGPVNFSIPASGTIFRNRSQSIPGGAPVGDYTYFMNITSGGNLIATDSFPFTVTTSGAGDGSTEWEVSSSLDE